MGFDTLHDKVSLLVCGKHRVCIYLLCRLCSLRTCLALYSTTAEWIFGIWDKMHYQIPVNFELNSCQVSREHFCHKYKHVVCDAQHHFVIIIVVETQLFGWF